MDMRTGTVIGLAVLALGGAVLSLSAAAISGRGSGRHQPQLYTHAVDYSWVAGRLERSELEGGFWQIVYLPEGASPDRYRGRFTLGTDPRLNAFAAGDFVVIYGRVAANQVSIFMSGTLYEFDRIDRIP